ncbi:MAG TPA: hypothetical protein VFT22_31755 [Kofleriaceae bacterium]|nr:hypothetical protein [Kofleriaceae bacterium]
MAPRSPEPAPAVRRVRADPDRAPIDPIAALTPEDDAEVSWVIPGPIQLELGGASIAAAGPGRPIEALAIDRQGNLERVAVRLEHARFSVWIQRANMLSVLTHDQRIEVGGVPVAGGDVEVVLRAGATVRRLAHRDRTTQVRYLGALQVEGWVPDAVLAEHGRARDGTGRIPTGRRTLMVIPGAVIRAEPRWAGGELAVVASGYFLDAIRDVDDSWTEISYEDGDVAVHGFVSRRDPPGRVHHWREGDSAQPITPTATVASGTCLYARAGGEPIGYVVGNRPADLEDAGAGWWTLTLDTPWGPIAFAARGALGTELVACAPPNTVPPATPPAPAPPAP